jgi:hypothetical protein
MARPREKYWPDQEGGPILSQVEDSRRPPLQFIDLTNIDLKNVIENPETR